MKKVVSIGLVVMLLFVLCACESAEPTQTIAGESHIAITKPSEVAATKPSSEATKPSSEATKPSSEATMPSSEATKPSSEATNPGSEPTTPTDSSQNTSPTDEMVWIPTKGGTKYHRTATCSGMDGPRQVTKTEAGHLGFDACKKCYK